MWGFWSSSPFLRREHEILLHWVCVNLMVSGIVGGIWTRSLVTFWCSFVITFLTTWTRSILLSISEPLWILVDNVWICACLLLLGLAPQIIYYLVTLSSQRCALFCQLPWAVSQLWFYFIDCLSWQVILPLGLLQAISENTWFLPAPAVSLRNAPQVKTTAYWTPSCSECSPLLSLRTG